MKKFFSIFFVTSILFFTGCSNNDVMNKINNSVTNKQMTLNFSFGTRIGKYTGEVDENGMPNGKGKFESKNPEGESWTYEGDFKNGHWEGQGTSIWSSGQKYVGE